VVRSEQDGAYGVTALQWEDISQAARDAIVKLCFAKQREEISQLKAGGEVLSSEEK
jgi:c-di-GMP-binding flagellar brake protein YcgR